MGAQNIIATAQSIVRTKINRRVRKRNIIARIKKCAKSSTRCANLQLNGNEYQTNYTYDECSYKSSYVVLLEIQSFPRICGQYDKVHSRILGFEVPFYSKWSHIAAQQFHVLLHNNVRSKGRTGALFNICCTNRSQADLCSIKSVKHNQMLMETCCTLWPLISLHLRVSQCACISPRFQMFVIDSYREL